MRKRLLIIATLAAALIASGVAGATWWQKRQYVATLDVSPEGLVDAAKRADDRAVEAIIDEGVDPNARNEAGETALHMAAFYGHPTTVELLIGEGANPQLGMTLNKKSRVRRKGKPHAFASMGSYFAAAVRRSEASAIDKQMRANLEAMAGTQGDYEKTLEILVEHTVPGEPEPDVTSAASPSKKKKKKKSEDQAKSDEK